MSLSPILSIMNEHVMDYPRLHRSRANLALHLIAAAPFWVGLGALAVGLGQKSLLVLAAGGVLIAVALGLQAWGHRHDRHAPPGFDGVLDAMVRLAAENLFTFPRFFFSGDWGRAWRAGRPMFLS